MNQPDELDLQRYLQTMWRSRRLVVAITLACGIAAFAFGRFVMEPVYKATSVLMVRSSTPSPLLSSLAGNVGALLPGRLSSDLGNPRQDVIAILKSRRVAGMVVRELGLQKAFEAPSEGEAITVLQGGLRVQTGKENQISVTAAARSPRLAADIANAFPRSLEKYQQTEDSSAARRHLRFVAGRLSQARLDLRRAEDALRSFQERNGIVAVDLSTAELVKQTSEVDAELTTARVALGETKRRLEALRPRLVRRAGSEGALPLTNAEETERLRGKLADLESDLIVAARAYTEEHPQVRELSTRIASVKAQLRAYKKSAMEAAYEGIVPELIDLEVSAIAAATREGALRGELDRLHSISRGIPRATLEFARLRREAEVQDELYRMLSRTYHEARIAAEQSLLPVSVLDPAEPPLKKSAPRVKVITLMGLLLGFVGAALACLLLDWIQAAGNGHTPREGGGRLRERAPEREPDAAARR